MTSKNQHTGDKQQTRTPSKEFLDNYDLIFRKSKVYDEDMPLPHFEPKTDR